MNTTQFADLLSAEKIKLVEELKQVGRINPDNKDDWEPVAGNLNADQAEAEERAGEITDFEDRSAIEYELEKRLNDVDKALARIPEGKYGLCETCGIEIDEKRLLANPSATMCREHMN
jgi:DnaK suppressor protein